MHRKIVSFSLVVLGCCVVLGCGSGSPTGGADDNKQPKLQGTPDPRIKGPATPGGAGGQKPAEIK